MLGLAVVMPSAREAKLVEDGDKTHTVCIAAVHSGEPLTYWYGSCWSKGDIKDLKQWTNTIESLMGSIR
jgi:hypothetical protein